jgi:uncharacterized protein
VEAEVAVAPELRLFLRPGRRAGPLRVAVDGTASLGHVVQSLGVPLTEVGQLLVNGGPAEPGYRPAGGDRIVVGAAPRPQPVAPARFLLDVHLGALARRMRLAGVDAAYANQASDDDLVEQANASRRVLLTQDRGLLRRRMLWRGAYVRGAHPDDQLADVLARFAPPLAPWTRCLACNGPLSPVDKSAVEAVLQPGTRRTYQAFCRCDDCGKVYWRGAHRKHLEAIVHAARRAVGAVGQAAGGGPPGSATASAPP